MFAPAAFAVQFVNTISPAFADHEPVAGESNGGAARGRGAVPFPVARVP